MTSRIHWFGFVAYWLAFVALTARQGQFPGLVTHPELWPYPYIAVVIVCFLLAALLAILYFILRPVRFPYSWRRALAALVYSALLLLIVVPSAVTDLPGYYYVPAFFALVTFICVLGLALLSAICALAGKRAA